MRDEVDHPVEPVSCSIRRNRRRGEHDGGFVLGWRLLSRSARRPPPRAPPPRGWCGLRGARAGGEPSPGAARTPRRADPPHRAGPRATGEGGRTGLGRQLRAARAALRLGPRGVDAQRRARLPGPRGGRQLRRGRLQARRDALDRPATSRASDRHATAARAGVARSVPRATDRRTVRARRPSGPFDRRPGDGLLPGRDAGAVARRAAAPRGDPRPLRAAGPGLGVAQVVRAAAHGQIRSRGGGWIARRGALRGLAGSRVDPHA